MTYPPEIVEALGGNEPTPQQWAAISHGATPCALIAGAGSGKTAVMAARVVYLTLAKLGRIENPSSEGAMPSEILCLTFTNKAAASLSERVRRATAALGLDEDQEATVLTYHAFAAQLLRDDGLRIGISPDQMLLSGAHRWQIANGLFADRVFEHLQIRSMRFPVSSVLELADHCANHLVDPLELARRSEAFASKTEVKTNADRNERETALERAELARLVHAYGERKRALGAIDYGDQIWLAVRLVREHPAVARAFRERYRAVLLDEYQDTNHAQGELLQRLCGPETMVMCVGDPDQNIYAWRGASLANILRFPEDFNGSRLPLYVNFRSGARILNVADAVIGSVPAQYRGDDKMLEPSPARGDGSVDAFVAADQDAEGREIARIIRETGVRLKEVAILCRKKRLMEPIRRALLDEGIPVEVADLGGLLKTPEIVDVVSWLRMLDDPARNVAVARILQGPRWRIGYRDVVALARWSMRHNKALREDLGVDEHPGDVAFPLAEAIDHIDDDDMRNLSAQARDRLRSLRGLIAELRPLCSGALDELVVQIAEWTGLMRELDVRSGPLAASARRNVLNFVSLVADFAPLGGRATLETLVAWLDAAEESESEDLEQAQPSDDDSVKMMTIHKAKGLEWDVVFVPGMAKSKYSKLFPDTDRQPNPLTQPRTLPFDLRGDADVLPRYEGNLAEFRRQLSARAMDEERRLCYVALTRARNRLVVSAAHWYDGPKDPYEPSIFYEEIAAHPACTEIGRALKPELNPLIDRRAAMAPLWPPPARSDRALPSGDGGGARYEELVRAYRERIELVRQRATATLRPAPPEILPASAIVEYARCPRAFYDAYVRPIPRPPSAAARLGSDIHRWIELVSTGRAKHASDAPGEPGMGAIWRASRFTKPLHAERPFLLMLGDVPVSGQIDAIFGEQDGPWEIVDYKSGLIEESSGVQLAIYALACREIWKIAEVTTTIFGLSDGTEHHPPEPGEEELIALAKAASETRDRPSCVCGACE